MRKLLLSSALAIALVGIGGGEANADLPDAACNDGTMNAHSNVPATTGNGSPIHAHEAIPESEDGTCGHGG